MATSKVGEKEKERGKSGLFYSVTTMRQAQLTNLAKKSDSLVAFLWLFFLFTISNVLLVYM
ncbi:MAG TPA: hypothetical protein H9850_00625, partial [Candidatus Anaerobiospirillum pullistercoris]|nr:hypothetical protein [Candidatus Anaerobiospirillum pullistercoris]